MKKNKEKKEKKIKEKKNNKKEKDIEEQGEKKHMLKYILFFIVVIIIICGLWARFMSTRGLIVKEYAIKTTELSEDYDGFKIVHFSDLHYGSTIGLKELKNIVKEINKQKPDIIVFTGDLFERNASVNDEEIEKVIKELKKLNPTIETLAVIGNHDYETKYWDKVVPNLDWKVLDNTYEYVYGDSKTPIVFVGYDDYQKGEPDYDNGFSYLNETDETLYTIVLVHEPDQIQEIGNYKFNLALAGHSHLGQVRLPLIGAIYTPTGSKKYYDEHYKIGESDLYISGGIGTSDMKIRFFNKPSINLYRFYTK